MSVPERRVLKKVLSKLKAETIISERRLLQSMEHKEKLFETVIETLEKSDLEKMRVRNVLEIVSRLGSSFDDFSSEVIRLIEQNNLYIESLEKHSSELDKAFWQGIEKKSKEIKRQIEQQEKLSKNEPSYRA